jgi:hypothetical protein
MRLTTKIDFPDFSGIRCLMMPYIQGDSASVAAAYAPYRDIIDRVFIKRGDIGFLTIDESLATKGTPHRGTRARYSRAIHTEAGKRPWLAWGGGWGSDDNVTLDRGVTILLANNLDNSCAVWDADHPDTSRDGDIGYAADQYPYADAEFLRAGEVYEIGILTPHESVPVSRNYQRQFLRIVSSGVHGREPYFTTNPLLPL